VRDKEEKTEILWALIEITTAILNVREMVVAVEEQNHERAQASFMESVGAIDKVQERLRALIQSLQENE
jgi:hypothetical protein